jgi:hypothetical protein
MTIIDIFANLSPPLYGAPQLRQFPAVLEECPLQAYHLELAELREIDTNPSSAHNLPTKHVVHPIENLTRVEL